jgi:hypothetical protein
MSLRNIPFEQITNAVAPSMRGVVARHHTSRMTL